MCPVDCWNDVTPIYLQLKKIFFFFFFKYQIILSQEIDF